jgi:hypothetical protein
MLEGRRASVSGLLMQREIGLSGGREIYVGVARAQRAGRALVAARPSRARFKTRRVSALRAAIADAGCVRCRAQFGHSRTPGERWNNPMCGRRFAGKRNL